MGQDQGKVSGLLGRRTFAGAAAAAPWVWTKAQTAAPPSVLFIMPDQWRGMDLGCAGNTQVRTPNIDALAARGVQFDSAVANTPVCCAARASLLTGRYAHQVNVAVNDLPLASDENGIAKMLARQGYYTGLIGKWHLEGGKRMPGFVEPGPRRQGFEFWAANICSHNYFKQTYFRDAPEPVAMKRYETFEWTDLALEFLDAAKERKQPYFLCVHYGPPHDPYNPMPPGFDRRHTPGGVEPRANWKAGAKRCGEREDIAGYYAAIDCLDAEIGRILRRADNNTIVLFLSDHGDMLGSQGTFLKRKPWEESARVPMIFSWKNGGVTGGWRTSAPVSHIDVVPTLLGLCGVKQTREMPGQDFTGFLKTRGGRAPRQSMLMSHGKTEMGEWAPWRGLRTRKWKYARFRDKPWMLYDLEADPFEMTNLVARREHAALRAQFDREIESWMEKSADSWDEQVDAAYR